MGRAVQRIKERMLTLGEVKGIVHLKNRFLQSFEFDVEDDILAESLRAAFAELGEVLYVRLKNIDELNRIVKEVKDE